MLVRIDKRSERRLWHCVRDESDPSVFGSARIGGVCVLPVMSGTEETQTLSSYGISSNRFVASLQGTRTPRPIGTTRMPKLISDGRADQ